MDIGEIIALLLVGALAGHVAARLLRGRSKGERILRDTLIGVIGAIVGTFIFNALDLSLPDIFAATITLADVVIAISGALIVLLVLRVLD